MTARIVVDEAMVERALAAVDACHIRAYTEKQLLRCQSRPEWMRAALEAALNDSAVAELVEILREARKTYLPNPTGINIKRLRTNAEFNARVDAALARIGGA